MVDRLRSPAQILMSGGGTLRDHFATGGAPTADTALKRGGRSRRSHHFAGAGVAPVGGTQVIGGDPRTWSPTTSATPTMKKGGRRTKHAAGDLVNHSMAGMANNMRPPTSEIASATPMMKHGGRRKRHAEGESVLHRAMGGAGKTRKNYPYT